MSKIKVSIIMPVLNVSKYLKECMDSVIGQTLEQIEIFCVDGGSTDGSLEILQEYASKDQRVKILEDTKHSSGYANNLGISKAQGEYIGIVETDDYIEPEMMETLYHIAKEQDVDVVRADYKMFFGNGDKRTFLEKRIATKTEQYGKVLHPYEDFDLFKNDMSTWAGIYRREFLLEQDIWHNETQGAAYQDNGFWFQVFAFAKSIYFVKESFYRYRIDNPNSSIHNKQKLYAICDEFHFIEQKLKKKNSYERLKDIFIQMKFIRYVSSYYRLADELKLEFAERFHQEMLESEIKHEIDRGNFTPEQLVLLNKILKSAQNFHESIANEKIQLKELLLNNNQIVQFGCGSDGVRLLGYLQSQDLLEKITCICDNNRGIQGSKLFGINICSFDEAIDKYPNAVFLIASLHYADEIKMQLLNYGVKEDNIVVVNLC